MRSMVEGASTAAISFAPSTAYGVPLPATRVRNRRFPMTDMASLTPKHFRWRMDGAVAIISLDRPERKNPLTFESYAELRDTFRALPYADDVKAVVFALERRQFFLRRRRA